MIDRLSNDFPDLANTAAEAFDAHAAAIHDAAKAREELERTGAYARRLGGALLHTICSSPAFQPLEKAACAAVFNGLGQDKDRPQDILLDDIVANASVAHHRLTTLDTQLRVAGTPILAFTGGPARGGTRDWGINYMYRQSDGTGLEATPLRSNDGDIRNILLSNAEYPQQGTPRKLAHHLIAQPIIHNTSARTVLDACRPLDEHIRAIKYGTPTKNDFHIIVGQEALTDFFRQTEDTVADVMLGHAVHHGFDLNARRSV